MGCLAVASAFMDENVPPVSPPPPPRPVTPPPVLTAPLAPRAPKRRYGWMIFAIILLVLLGISFLFNLVSLAGNGLRGRTSYSRTSGPRLDEVVKEDNDSLNKIVVIEVNG